SGGDGGTVEVSSHGVLNDAGMVDLTAAAGHTGTLLLDPPDVLIENNGGSNSGINFDGSEDVFTPDDSESTSILDTGVLEAELNTASVTVSTQVSSTVNNSGGISVLSPLTWSGNTTLTLAASGTITLSAPVTASHGDLVLDAEQNIVMQAPVSALSLTATASGTAGITLGSTVTTAGGGQTYESLVTLSGNVILTDNDGGSIDFYTRIDGTTPGADALTINAPSSDVYLNGNIGYNVPTGALTFNGAELHFVGDIQITTAGGAITQTGTTELESGEGTSFVTLSTTGGNTGGAPITFAGPIFSEISGESVLYLYAGDGVVTFGGDVGAESSLLGFQVVGSTINLGAPGTTTGITVSTSGYSDEGGGQGYFGAVVLNGSATMNSTGDSYIYINGTIDSGSAGQAALTINNDGPASLTGNIGSGSPLASLSITAPGGTQLYMDSITTGGGGQTYNTPLLLATDVTLTDTGAGAITFSGTIDTFEVETDPSLTVATGGPVTFNDAIGEEDPITNLTATGSSIAFNASATVTNDITAITAGSGGTSNGDITLASGVTLAASGTGNAILIEAGSDHLAGDPTGGDFINNSGAGALVTPNGNWVVYTGDPVGQGTVDGGLTYTPQFDYDTGHAVSGGNSMLFRGGFLTLTPTGGTATYNASALDPAYSDDTANYTISGNPVPDAGLTLSGS
ncbi:MAG: beta strand repeat-containing protein, partial [Acetobacteraceae bacterium]